MSLFSCKTCKAHEAHIKSLEAALKHVRDQQLPAITYLPDLEEYQPSPTLQPVFIPKQELEEREFSADALLTNNYE